MSEDTPFTAGAYADILVVDDEPDIRELIKGVLEDEGYDVRTADGSEAALAEIALRPPSMVLLDIWLEGSPIDGLEVLVEIKKRTRDVPVVMISGHGNIDTAVMAIREGAYDYLEKPFKTERLILSISRALEHLRLKTEVSLLKTNYRSPVALVGEAPSIQSLRSQVLKLGRSNSRVMLIGDEGLARHDVARSIHEGSERAQQGPFISLFLQGHSEEELDIMLFGSEGQGEIIPGGWERAHKGTLYLEGVDCLPKAVQKRLYLAVTGKCPSRVGGVHPLRSDVRLISATSSAIKVAMERDEFSQDLYDRLAVIPLVIPSLTDRLSDIPLLARHLLQEIIREQNLPPITFSEEALAVMATFDWPGNLVQLRNAIERIVIECSDTKKEIEASDLPDMVGGRLPKLPGESAGHELLSMSLREARELFEKEYLLAQISRFGNNISRAADKIGMERAALHRKIKSLGLSLDH